MARVIRSTSGKCVFSMAEFSLFSKKDSLFAFPFYPTEIWDTSLSPSSTSMFYDAILFSQLSFNQLTHPSGIRIIITCLHVASIPMNQLAGLTLMSLVDEGYYRRRTIYLSKDSIHWSLSSLFLTASDAKSRTLRANLSLLTVVT